eukprot:5165425-Amphidinium_carterae.1
MHFSVKSITVKTADRAKSLRARRHPELDVSADVSMADDASGGLDLGSQAQAFLVEASIRQLPEKVEEMALSKMLSVDLAAVRATKGEERKKWHEALKKEYDNL